MAFISHTPYFKAKFGTFLNYKAQISTKLKNTILFFSLKSNSYVEIKNVEFRDVKVTSFIYIRFYIKGITLLTENLLMKNMNLALLSTRAKLP